MIIWLSDFIARTLTDVYGTLHLEQKVSSLQLVRNICGILNELLVASRDFLILFKLLQFTEHMIRNDYIQ